MSYFALALSFIIAFCSELEATEILKEKLGGESFKLIELTKGHDVPWGLTFINNDEILFSEISGQFKILNLKNKKVRSVKNPPVVTARGQGGLLDVRKDSSSEWIFYTYSLREAQTIFTVLEKAKLKADSLTKKKVLLKTKVKSATGRHFGSRIALVGDKVFFTMGDRGKRETAQDLSSHAGTVMRLNKDGSVPKDNPFVGKKGVLPEIWTYGHRNPQGLFYDSKTTLLWEMEHGPRGGDEINLIIKGKNYGWPKASYGKEYWGPIDVGVEKVKGTEQPVKYYDPSIAPCGLLVYSGKVFKKWEGAIFSGALKLRHLNMLELSGKKAGQEHRLLKSLEKRIRNVIEGPDGLIYLSSDSGGIYQLAPQ